MLLLPHPLHDHLFRPIPARGFLLMRTAWSALTLGVFLLQWQDVLLYYGRETLFPYFLVLLSLLCVLLNVQTRFALVAAFLLFTFFLHRNPLPFGGGELLLHHMGFLLMVTPEKNGTMPVWPYRLLLFQVIVLYVSSAWQKLLGVTWLDGSALAIALAHPHFARFPGLFADLPRGVLALFSTLIIVWELSWIVLLLPCRPRLKRVFLLSGVVFHLVILLLLKVGSFSPAMLTAYLGLLPEADTTQKEPAESGLSFFPGRSA